MSERPRPQSKVSLEDLLRLKRAERPAPEFWVEFEDQLRRKQLAAIVDKRPWWRRLSVASFAKISLPVGATAVIAFTLVAVRERGQQSPDMATMAATSASPAMPLSAPALAPTVASPAVPDGSMIVALDQATTPAIANVAASDNTMSMPASTPTSSEMNGNVVAIHDSPEPSLAQVILGLEGTPEIDARPQFPSAAAPLLASLDDLAGTNGLSLIDTNPLTQLSEPRNDRRARLLASVDAQDRGDLVSGNSRVVRSRERIANRLAEQSLYDSISRLGLNADSVSIKF
ncbi:hypothetical protein CMV30_11440 [Nibricoccus aquaticus]|uniref:Uncharacterized protein n=1 Tax=Nibricoccus aquaticus TaxID=2576891 RepID=A0A290QE33_9BACT|nr:hypothetical protein [Nibricoccus aquaticus]ATC64516.1 hypothetical protein CMV30_11440 [Nibricoccus aquaticus]